MKKESDVRVCKNKKCQKVLPAGYKHAETSMLR